MTHLHNWMVGTLVVLASAASTMGPHVAYSGTSSRAAASNIDAPEFALTGTDVDFDGISDAQELADGTDPQDSSDALAWHPEWTERPRAIFGPDEASSILERLNRTDEPFATLAQRIRSNCAATPEVYDDEDQLDQGAIYTNANIARNCAFLAYLESDPALACKARDILLELPRDLGLPSIELFDNTDIHVAEALSSAAQAYDFLEPTGFVDVDALEQIEDNLLSLAGSMYHFYVEVAPIWWQFCYNNHTIKSVDALGMIGMTLNNNPEAAKYVSLATTETAHLFDFQSTEDGGYAEGLGYLSYTSDNFLPFVIMYHRYARGASIPYRQICDLRRPGEGCRERDVTIDDFYVDPRVHAVFTWWATLMMPDGMNPDFDDANRKSTFNGLIAGITGEGYFRAAWERNLAFPYYSKGCEDLSVETLVLFPPDLPAAWPSFANRFQPDAGTVVFRSGWEEDARYLLLLGEHDKMRTGGHEHPDGTAILVHAYGEYLVMDSGYGSWDQRLEVAKADNHSLVLIDGEGPHSSFRDQSTGVDTYLESFREADGYVAAEARTGFSGVDQVRTVYFVDQSFFVVVDRLAPDMGSHRYTSLWHLNGGGDTDGQLETSSSGATLLRPRAGMVLGVASTRDAPGIDRDLASHAAPGYGVIEQHEVVSATVDGEALAMLGVVYPWRSEEPGAWAEQVVSAGGAASVLVGAEDGTWHWLVVINEPGHTAVLDLSAWGLPEVESDADFLAIRFEGGEAMSILEEGGTAQVR